MTICSVNLPPNSPVDIGEVRRLVKQLSIPFMLQGDFTGTTQREAVGTSTQVAEYLRISSQMKTCASSTMIQ